MVISWIGIFWSMFKEDKQSLKEGKKERKRKRKIMISYYEKRKQGRVQDKL
jgi:hypothetical protein